MSHPGARTAAWERATGNGGPTNDADERGQRDGASRRGGGRQRDGWARVDPGRSEPSDLFVGAVFAWRQRDEEVVDLFVNELASLPPPEVARAIGRWVEGRLAEAWRTGWQPADVHRLVARQQGPSELAVVRSALAADAADYDQLGRAVAPAWMAQLDSLGAERWWAQDRPYLVQLDDDWAGVVRASIRVAGLLDALPVLPTLAPPPHQWRAGVAADVASSMPTGLLDKVRALLAKAESSTFEAEAAAFTAKAQELMTRHRLDRAVLGATDHTGEAPVGRRVPVDDPYAGAKACLLVEICEANGTHAVWSKSLGFSTVMGFADDIDAVEELYTSLLVQATAALVREGSKQDRSGRSRTTRFRRSFLLGFATRIGARLSAATADTVARADDGAGGRLLPMLAARDDEVRAATDRTFPEVTRSRSSGASDGEGWFAGTLFGDRADLGLGPMVEREAS